MKRRCQWGLGGYQCGFRSAYLITSDKEIDVCGKHLTAVLQAQLSRKDVPNVLVAGPRR